MDEYQEFKMSGGGGSGGDGCCGLGCLVLIVHAIALVLLICFAVSLILSFFE
ncbi:MAG: hypothetical protein RSA27_08105 [Oscillospiraceae bacterium]